MRARESDAVMTVTTDYEKLSLIDKCKTRSWTRTTLHQHLWEIVSLRISVTAICSNCWSHFLVPSSTIKLPSCLRNRTRLAQTRREAVLLEAFPHRAESRRRTRLKIARLEDLGVICKDVDSLRAAPTSVIPQNDQSVRL